MPGPFLSPSKLSISYINLSVNDSLKSATHTDVPASVFQPSLSLNLSIESTSLFGIW